MTVALLFGSFNPIHIGHIKMAEAAIAYGVDEVWFIPSPQNPLKDSKELLSIDLRVNMVNLAIAEVSQFKTVDIEKHLETPSFTHRTLDVLSGLYEHNFVILCGTDVLHQLPLWKNFTQILENYSFLVCKRAVSSDLPSTLEAYQNKFIFIPFEPNAISASSVRSEGTRSEIAAVDQYIKDHHLYGH